MHVQLRYCPVSCLKGFQTTERRKKTEQSVSWAGKRNFLWLIMPAENVQSLHITTCVQFVSGIQTRGSVSGAVNNRKLLTPRGLRNQFREYRLDGIAVYTSRSTTYIRIDYRHEYG